MDEIKAELDALCNNSVCIHSFHTPNKRGDLIKINSSYFLEIASRPLQEIDVYMIEVIEDEHIYMKGYNGR